MEGLSRALLCGLAVLALALRAAATPPCTYCPGAAWSVQQVLQVDNGNASHTLTDFPLLVTLNPGNVNYSNIAANGNDLRFYDASCVELSYEIDVRV